MGSWLHSGGRAGYLRKAGTSIMVAAATDSDERTVGGILVVADDLDVDSSRPKTSQPLLQGAVCYPTYQSDASPAKSPLDLRSATGTWGRREFHDQVISGQKVVPSPTSWAQRQLFVPIASRGCASLTSSAGGWSRGPVLVRCRYPARRGLATSASLPAATGLAFRRYAGVVIAAASGRRRRDRRPLSCT